MVMLCRSSSSYVSLKSLAHIAVLGWDIGCRAGGVSIGTGRYVGRV
jgi:hypothetical protein